MNPTGRVGVREPNPAFPDEGTGIGYNPGVRAIICLICLAAPAQEWKRHVLAEGFANQTVVAADFTGQGRLDVITGDISANRTVLLVAPDWKQVVLHEGIRTLFGVAMDVDGDGDIDLIGCRYTPGIIYWLERPANPLKDPWPIPTSSTTSNAAAPTGSMASLSPTSTATAPSNSSPPAATPKANSPTPSSGTASRKTARRPFSGSAGSPPAGTLPAFPTTSASATSTATDASISPPAPNSPRMETVRLVEQPYVLDQPFKKHIIATDRKVLDEHPDGRR